MMEFKKLNNLSGWLTFVVALIVYVITIEDTASFWDAGEFIAVSSKLEVGEIYKIVSAGTTSWTSVGASANTQGVIFRATGSVTGTGTADKPNSVLLG